MLCALHRKLDDAVELAEIDLLDELVIELVRDRVRPQEAKRDDGQLRLGHNLDSLDLPQLIGDPSRQIQLFVK